MTDQNPENDGAQGQNPQPDQSQQQPPAVPQQPVQPQPQQPQSQEQGQPQANPQYQGQPQQPQGQPQYQGQPQPQYQNQPQYQGQPNYGQQANYGGLPPQDKPNNYMAMNIVATIVGFLCGGCCIQGIVGIVGIVFSSQVDSKFNQGDLNGALSSAQTAKTIGIVSLILSGLAIVGMIVYLIIAFSAVGMDSFMDSYMNALEDLQ